MFSGMFVVVFSGTSTEIQHDVSYKAKFMAAVRLWRKRDEEKRVWGMVFLHCIHLFMEIML